MCRIILNTENAVKNKTKSMGLDNICKVCSREKANKYRDENLEKVKLRETEYRKRNRQKAVERTRKWREKNRAKRNKVDKDKYHNSPQRKMAVSIRNRINKFIKRKSNSSSNLIGCTIEYYINYIEKMFTDGMSWDNYGEWHIDHIKPLSKFNLSNEEEVLKAFNYKNTQPLWSCDNLKKSDKYEEPL